MKQEGEVAHAMRDLVCRHRQRGHQPQRHVRQKRRRNQNPIERVVDAIADEDKHPRRTVTTVIVPTVIVRPVVVIVHGGIAPDVVVALVVSAIVVIVRGGIVPGGVVAVTLADVVPGMALVLRAVIVLAAFPVTVALVPMVMSVIAATVVFVASPVHVVMPSFVSGVITAMACEPRGVAVGERTAVNSRLSAHIARKCDALGCALGS